VQGIQLEEIYKEYNNIQGMPINKGNVFDLVRSYLIHYAFVETLQALEEENNSDQTSMQVAPDSAHQA